MELEIKEVPESQSTIILYISGELGFDSITKISNCFEEIEDLRKHFVIVDMTAVSYISSAALGEFMGARKRLIEKNGDLVFTSMKMDIRTKLSLMGATKIFHIYSDNRSALNTYKWHVEHNPENIHITFPPFLAIVPPIRNLVSNIAKQKEYGNKDIFRIETIVDEICNNAIEHGKQDENQSVDLKVKIEPDKIEIDVTNVSDPEKMASLRAFLKPRAKDECKSEEKRGRGLTLIKMLTDELTVDYSEQGTSVRVKKVREE